MDDVLAAECCVCHKPGDTCHRIKRDYYPLCAACERLAMTTFLKEKGVIK